MGLLSSLFGGDKKTTTTATTNTSNMRDSRLVVGDGGYGVSGDAASLVLTTTDSRSFTDTSNSNNSYSDSRAFTDTSNSNNSYSDSRRFTDATNNSDNRTFTDNSDNRIDNRDYKTFADYTNNSDNRTFADNTNNSDNRTFADNSVTQITDGGAFSFASKAFEDAVFAANTATAKASETARAALAGQGAAVDSAFAFASGADARNAQGFSSLLSSGVEMFGILGESLDKERSTFSQLTSATQSGLASAYQMLTAEKSGSLDNKTIMILSLAGIAAAVFVMRKA